MYLWNDYEGKTIAGMFPLERLLRTEGRSGFFETRGREGQPAVVRLTESLNDDDRMRERYRTLAALGAPSLLTIEGFGTAELDGTPLFYLLMEPSAESLGDVLRERALTVEETDEVASVVLTALSSLHGAGYVHGLVEADSVLAAGERIKLRSDCAHPVGEGGADRGELRAEDRAAFAAAVAGDVRGAAALLYRALTQARLVDETDSMQLPEPYAVMVRQAVRGTWGVEEMLGELRRLQRLRAPLVPPAPGAAGVGDAAPAAGAAVGGPVGGPGIAAAGTDEMAGEGTLPGWGTGTVEQQGAQLPLVYPPTPEAENVSAAGTLSGRRTLLDEDDAEPAPRTIPWVWIAVVVGAVVLLLVVLRAMGGHAPAGAKAVAAPVVAPTPSSGPAPAPITPQASAVMEGPVHPIKPAAAAAAGAGERVRGGAPVWRVVAYTYRREGEAASKARAVAAHHHDLHAEVFTPSGHGPYLVTLGGAMSREQAEALRERARRDGLARDVYVQNYSH